MNKKPIRLREAEMGNEGPAVVSLVSVPDNTGIRKIQQLDEVQSLDLSQGIKGILLGECIDTLLHQEVINVSHDFILCPNGLNVHSNDSAVRDFFPENITLYTPEKNKGSIFSSFLDIKSATTTLPKCHTLLGMPHLLKVMEVFWRAPGEFYGKNIVFAGTKFVRQGSVENDYKNSQNVCVPSLRFVNPQVRPQIDLLTLADCANPYYPLAIYEVKNATAE